MKKKQRKQSAYKKFCIGCYRNMIHDMKYDFFSISGHYLYILSRSSKTFNKSIHMSCFTESVRWSFFNLVRSLQSPNLQRNKNHLRKVTIIILLGISLRCKYITPLPWPTAQKCALKKNSNPNLPLVKAVPNGALIPSLTGFCCEIHYK